VYNVYKVEMLHTEKYLKSFVVTACTHSTENRCYLNFKCHMLQEQSVRCEVYDIKGSKRHTQRAFACTCTIYIYGGKVNFCSGERAFVRNKTCRFLCKYVRVRMNLNAVWYRQRSFYMYVYIRRKGQFIKGHSGEINTQSDC
jgi:hypothetical protein